MCFVLKHSKVSSDLVMLVSPGDLEKRECLSDFGKMVEYIYKRTTIHDCDNLFICFCNIFTLFFPMRLNCMTDSQQL